MKTVTTSKRPVLRLSTSSYREVTRVFWYDLNRGTAGVLLEPQDGVEECREVPTDELEAITPDTRRNVPLDQVLRDRATVVTG